MQCPACGHENPDGFKFCGECGAALQAERVCASCGTANAASLKFCGECGTALAAAPKPEAERPKVALPTSFAGGRYAVRRFLGRAGASGSTWRMTSGWTGTSRSR